MYNPPKKKGKNIKKKSHTFLFLKCFTNIKPRLCWRFWIFWKCAETACHIKVSEPPVTSLSSCLASCDGRGRNLNHWSLRSRQSVACSFQKTFEGPAGTAWARRDNEMVKTLLWCSLHPFFFVPRPEICVFRQINSDGSTEVSKSKRLFLPSCWESWKRLAWLWPIARCRAKGRKTLWDLRCHTVLPFCSRIWSARKNIKEKVQNAVLSFPSCFVNLSNCIELTPHWNGNLSHYSGIYSAKKR